MAGETAADPGKTYSPLVCINLTLLLISTN